MQEDNQQPSKLERLLEFLSCTFVSYPFDEVKDSKYFELLIKEFADLDVEDHLHQFHAWTLDQTGQQKIYYRSRFRSWLKRARDYKTVRPMEMVWNGAGGRNAQSRW